MLLAIKHAPITTASLIDTISSKPCRQRRQLLTG
jgi:hypothetical protein